MRKRCEPNFKMTAEYQGPLVRVWQGIDFEDRGVSEHETVKTLVDVSVS